MTSYIVVFITTGSARESKRISDGLLKGKLAACVSVLTGVASRYWWKGKIEAGREHLLVVKTRKSKLKRIITAVQRLHSYSVPEVVALPVLGGNQAYLQWIKESVR